MTPETSVRPSIVALIIMAKVESAISINDESSQILVVLIMWSLTLPSALNLSSSSDLKDCWNY